MRQFKLYASTYESVEQMKAHHISDIALEINAIPKLFSLHNDKKKILFGVNELLLDSLNLSSDIKIIKEPISINIITKDEIILSSNKIVKKKKKTYKTIHLNELNKGDYVVHRDYGIGIFNGIKQTMILGITSDFIEVIYQNDDKLLLPTHNLNLITKYIANTSSIPMLDRLGKGSFAKIKERVRPKLLEIAKEIVELADKR